MPKLPGRGKRTEARATADTKRKPMSLFGFFGPAAEFAILGRFRFRNALVGFSALATESNCVRIFGHRLISDLRKDIAERVAAANKSSNSKRSVRRVSCFACPWSPQRSFVPVSTMSDNGSNVDKVTIFKLITGASVVYFKLVCNQFVGRVLNLWAISLHCVLHCQYPIPL